MRWLRGKHSFAFGGEVRRFYNNNFALDTGMVVFPSISAFINDQVGSFNINLSNGASKILEPAFGLFAEDSYKLRPNFTLILGLRYDYNNVLSDSQNRFVEFVPSSISLIQVGTNGLSEPYNSDAKLFQPRVGFAWDPWGDGKTSVRAGYAILADQPVTGIVLNMTLNPPFGDPLNVNSAQVPTLSLLNAATVAGPSGLAPTTIFHGFRDPYVQSYNLTLQRQVTSTLGLQAGYIGSKGTHLRLARNLNQPFIGQPVGGTDPPPSVPFPALSATSPIRPGSKLGNITEIDSSGNSNYNALWVSASKRFASGLQFDASYTYSKSLDYNSLSSQGVVLEDSTNPRLNYGPSDFDARNRFVINAVYDLPFKGNRLVSGWEISGISQAQSGNPLTVVMNTSGPTGNFTLRPDVTAPVQVGYAAAASTYGIQWIENPTVLVSPSGPKDANGGFTYHFGNLGRNSIIGPSFVNTDFSLIKRTKITERLNTEFRAEFFDIFNHPNFGNPNLRLPITGSPLGTFGVITSTRFSTGDFGSARQIQLALKLEF